MTTQKKLKASVRARMDKTGEAYMVARRHILNQLPSDEYVLRGGIHPDTSSLASVLANRGISNPTNNRPLSEAMILGVGGGLGAGYILWQFGKYDHPVVTIGFRNNSQYPDRWFRKTCRRLGVPIEIHETSGEKRAAGYLKDALTSGLPAIAYISIADLPYWHLPSEQSGIWGSTIVVYGQQSDRFLIDDRNLKPLSLADEDLSASRGRIPSYKNRLLVVDPAAVELDNDALLAAVESGLADQVEHLSSKSDSFSLPAIAKWARMLTDERHPKGWGQAFVDGHGLVGALVSAHEGVNEVGMLWRQPAFVVCRLPQGGRQDHRAASRGGRARLSQSRKVVGGICLDLPRGPGRQRDRRTQSRSAERDTPGRRGLGPGRGRRASQRPSAGVGC